MQFTDSQIFGVNIVSIYGRDVVAAGLLLLNNVIIVDVINPDVQSMK